MKIFTLLTLLLATVSTFAATDSLEGTARFSGCSGSLVKFKNQSMQDKAVILTAGFCVSGNDNLFVSNSPLETTIRLFDKDKEFVDEAFKTTKIIYATQTDTDVALLELEQTYQEIFDKHGISPFVVADKNAKVGDKISVISGFIRVTLDCFVDAIIFKLVEGKSITRNSYRLGGDYADSGTGGAPMVIPGTRDVLGVTNTNSTSETTCGEGSVCEVSESGSTQVHPETSYGQQITKLNTCLDERANFNLKQAGCQMPGGDSWVK